MQLLDKIYNATTGQWLGGIWSLSDSNNILKDGMVKYAEQTEYYYWNAPYGGRAEAIHKFVGVDNLPSNFSFISVIDGKPESYYVDYHISEVGNVKDVKLDEDMLAISYSVLLRYSLDDMVTGVYYGILPGNIDKIKDLTARELKNLQTNEISNMFIERVIYSDKPKGRIFYFTEKSR